MSYETRTLMFRRFLNAFLYPARAVLAICCAVALIFLCAAGPTAAATDELVLRTGDVLSLTVIGDTDRSYSVPVEPDGMAWFPVIGAFQVSGRSLNEIRAWVTEAYSASSLPFEQNGTLQLLRRAQIHLGVEFYRPIYVGGAIDRAVIVPFRPGLNLRQVLIIAASQQPVSQDSVDSSGRSESLVRQLERIEARIWGLRARLGKTDVASFDNAFLDRSTRLQQLATLERENVLAFFKTRERELISVEALLIFTKERLSALSQQRENELEAKIADDAAMENLRDLSDRGLASASRIAEARRAALTSATRVLQLETAIADERVRMSDLGTQQDKLSNLVDEFAWTELADQMGLFYQTQVTLSALLAAGPVREYAALPAQEIMLTRDSGDTSRVRMDDATVTLSPGDTIEILAAETDTIPCIDCE